MSDTTTGFFCKRRAPDSTEMLPESVPAEDGHTQCVVTGRDTLVTQVCGFISPVPFASIQGKAEVCARQIGHDGPHQNREGEEFEYDYGAPGHPSKGQSPWDRLRVVPDIADDETRINQETIDVLERGLEMARRGEIVEVLVTGTTPRGTTTHAFSSCKDGAKRVGLLTLALWDMLRHAHESD